MRIEKNRHLTELLTLFDANEPVTAEVLAGKMMSSVRTVKADMKWMDEELQAEGTARIVSHKAKGYSIDYLDDKKCHELYYNLMVLGSLYMNRSIMDTNRWLYITQKLLANGKAKKQELCDSLYVSESTLSKALSDASAFLNSFHIQLKSDSVHGLYIQGSEQDLRSCIVEVACSSYHDAQLLYPVPEFDEMIYHDNDSYQNVRHALLKLIRESRMAVSDISSKKLATHLCLIRNRTTAGFFPVLSDDAVSEIRETYEYSLACSVFADEIIHEYIGECNEIEIINFARVLIINRDIDLRHTDDVDTLQPQYVIENQKIFHEIREKMKDGPYYPFLSLQFMRIYETDYESLFLQLYLKHVFDHTDKRRLVTYVEGDIFYNSPLAMNITRIMMEYLSEMFGEGIDSVEVQAIASLNDYIFKRIKYPYKKLKLATTCMEGKVIGNQVKESLDSHYGEYIESNDVFDLYEMRRINFSDYDALIMQNNQENGQNGHLYYAYPIKIVPYQGLDTKDMHGGETLFHSLFIDGYSRRILDQICTVTNVFKDTDMQSRSMIFQILSYKYGKTDEDQKFIQNHLERRNRIISYVNAAGVMLIEFDYDHTGKEFLDIYKLKQTLVENEMSEIRYVVVVCMHNNLSVSELKQINRMLQTATNDWKTMERVIENPAEQWEKIWKAILKNSFINGI